MKIQVLAFARLRELLKTPRRSLELPEGARVEDAWSALLAAFPALREERGTTRVARNGRLVAFDDALTDGDELALLPPVGGG
jgi:MoaE-MoaD fusion protein